MHRIAFLRTGWLGLALGATLLAGCGDINSDVTGLAPAGVKTTGFAASLMQPGGTPVAGAAISLASGGTRDQRNHSVPQ